ncbi:hypothetical protein TNCV_2289891 [Trichonephila clavipes]|uniref:Uncharacterized protein n=1 Tax=Trichonephila clavipes TaxID=2585209 RepID=A0A8X6RNZ3_TRICX|nr:hypothetical protein TNCV_2289891 [Trichonephila clavipes]
MRLLGGTSLVLAKEVTPKCLGGPPVDRDRFNVYPGIKPTLSNTPTNVRIENELSELPHHTNRTDLDRINVYQPPLHDGS